MDSCFTLLLLNGMHVQIYTTHIHMHTLYTFIPCMDKQPTLYMCVHAYTKCKDRISAWTEGAGAIHRCHVAWLQPQACGLLTLRLPLVVKALPQMVQPKGFSPVWVRSWICRALAEEKVFPHD